MTRSPRRCLLAAGLAAMVLPVATTAAGAADSPYVDRPGIGRGALFPDPTAPRSRLLVEPPPEPERRPAPVQRQAPRPAPPKAPAPTPPTSPKMPQPPETKPTPAPEAAADPAPVPARKETRVVQPAPAKPAVPGVAVPRPAPVKPDAPALAQAAKPEVKPEATAPEPAAAPEPADQTASETAAVPEPPPLPDLPPARSSAAPEPTPKPEVAPAEPVQQASLPPSGAEDGDVLTVTFAPDVAEPPTGATDSLEALAARLETNSSLRLRLNAYAPGTEAEESRSRRLSLSRALAVRSRLVDAGISSTRIEVRALGNTAPEGASPDRVDIIVLER